MKKIYLYILLFAVNMLNAQPLSQRLDALVGSETLKTSEIGVTVFDLTEGRSLYDYQSEKLYRPASIEKIITSVTTLARLGENYTFDTQLRYTGTIRQDTLFGNLYVIGGFDPLFGDEDLGHLADAIRGVGIRYIADTLAADVSMMDSLYWGPGWSWDDTPSSFQPYLSPLMLNQGCVDITVTPQEKGTAAIVECSPRSDYYQVDNQAVSLDPSAGKLKITRNWLSNGNQITITGNVPRVSKSTINVVSSQDFFMRTLVNRLEERGIGVANSDYGECPVSTDSIPVTPIIRLSRPLREVLKEALKESNNLCAEAMFYHIAKGQFSKKRIGSADGTDAINSFMNGAIGMNPDHFNIVDGSGVSLYNYVSPKLMLEYLKYAYYHRPVFLPLYESLPIAGVDGTLRNRMKGTAAANNVHAKTGSVKGVSSLAGYVKARNGHELAFVIINQNIMQLSKARDMQDKICVELAK